MVCGVFRQCLQYIVPILVILWVQSYALTYKINFDTVR